MSHQMISLIIRPFFGIFADNFKETNHARFLLFESFFECQQIVIPVVVHYLVLDRICRFLGIRHVVDFFLLLLYFGLKLFETAVGLELIIHILLG